MTGTEITEKCDWQEHALYQGFLKLVSWNTGLPKNANKFLCVLCVFIVTFIDLLL